MEIKVGTSFLLEPIDIESSERYKCKIIDYKEGVIYIDYPVNTVTRRTAFLVDGAQFRVSFVDENKVPHAFKTEILGRVKGTIPAIKLLFPSEESIVKMQRREFVRVITPVDVSILFENKFTQYVTEDISAGGLAIVSNRPVPFNEGQTVDMTVVLPFESREDGVKYVQTTARVVRIIEEDGRLIVPLQFTNVDEVDKQLIIRFCFERQVQIRKKETTFSRD